MNSHKLCKPSALAPTTFSLYEMHAKSQSKMMTDASTGLELASLQGIFNSNYLPASGFHRERSHFERSIFQIGLPIIAGGSVSGVGGFGRGVSAIRRQYPCPKLQRTQLWNHVIKRGMGTANKLGSLALLYSACNMFLSYVRDGDDEVNKLAAGALTGMLYKSTAGLRHCAVGGSIGLGLAASYYLLRVNTIKEFISEKF